MQAPSFRHLSCLLAIVSDAVATLPTDALRKDPQSLKQVFQPKSIHMEVVGISKKDLLEGIAVSLRDFQKLSSSLSV